MSGAIATSGRPNMNNSHHNISAYEMQQQNASNHEYLIVDHNELNNEWLILYSLIYPFVMAIGIIVNYKLFNNVKKEAHQEKGKVIQTIMKTYTIIQIVGWPFINWYIIIIRIVHSSYNAIDPILYVYAFEVGRLSFVFLRLYVGFNSLIVAVCRYVFIVWDDKISQYGISKARKILICLSFSIPMMISILWCMVVDSGSTVGGIFVYRKIPSSSSLDDNNSYEVTTGSEYRINQPPIYNFVQNQIPSSLLYGMRLVCYGLSLLITANVLEGFLYLHTFLHARR